MLIEFTGSSSSGKSYVIEAIKLKSTRNLVSSYDFILKKMKLDGLVRNSKAKSIFVELFLFPTMLSLYLRDIGKYNKIIKILRSLDASRFMKLNLLRNVFKVHAQYLYLLPCVGSDEICYFDEGPVHQFHNIFVHYKYDLDFELLDWAFNNFNYATQYTVIVSATEQTVAKRALERKDAPWKDLDIKQWTHYAKNAHKFYAHVSSVFLEHIDFKYLINDQSVADISQQIDSLIGELEGEYKI